MTIAAGERLPDVTFKVKTEDGAQDLTTKDVFAGKRVVLIGLPGAFTPTCSNHHLPGYLENYDALLARGVDTVAVVSVNDMHVMAAWAHFTGGHGRLLFLADGNGEFARATGLGADMSAAGFGHRLRRFSMIVDDGVVTKLFIEEARGQAIQSGVARMLEEL